MPAGSIELKLHDMVRAAKSSEHCTIKMAKENATPRFSIFRNKRMRGWWPFIKLKDQEDEEREKREDKQKKKKKKWSSSVKPEDVEFTDPSGNKYLLTVRQGGGASREPAFCLCLDMATCPAEAAVTQLPRTLCRVLETCPICCKSSTSSTQKCELQWHAGGVQLHVFL